MSLPRLAMPVVLLLLLLTAALALASPATAREPGESDRALLARADAFAAAPDGFRVRAEVHPGERAPISLEIWRSGDDRALVRFLDEDDRGKFLLRRDGRLFFIAPGAARPVPLSSSHRLQGVVSLDEILGLSLAEDYRIERVEEGSGVVTFHLVAREGSDARWPRVRHAVRLDRELPVRTDLLFPDGRVARVLEYVEWLDPERLVPGLLRAQDPVRGGPAVEIRMRDFTPRPVPEALFDLEDADARDALGEPGSR